MPFSKLKCKWLGVFGNNDGDKKALAMKSDGLIVDHPYNYDLSDKKVIITHELEDIPDLQGKLERTEAHIIIYGHTHKTDIRKVKNTLVVNPGECGGWLYGKSTVAIIDLDKMEAREIVL
jgi:putative phosphoesterase